MNNYKDIDVKKYKENFFAVLKSPSVILPIIMSIVGIIIASVSFLGSNQRMKLIIAIIGCIITMTAGEMINLNIRKGMSKNDPEE